ncbi:short chain dehydrogenase family protein [Atractiella rhizophila]|nr:short chain dehydrogenase family protein [Atractiella rhizophila]
MVEGTKKSGMFAGKTVFVSGGSRGIGLAVALRLAREGANITIAAKTVTPHPKLPGTIFTAAKEIEQAGGKALPIEVDIRNEKQVEEAIEKTVSHFGGLDILINNASAISLTPTESLSVKQFDLINAINTRGTWLATKFAIPHLRKSNERGRNPHILSFAPPLKDTIVKENFEGRTAYALGKFAMSILSLGHSGELAGEVGVNCLWPYTIIDTSATNNIPGTGSNEAKRRSRDANIMADAAFEMLKRDGKSYTGHFEIDELFLRREIGYTENMIKDYSLDKETPLEELLPDFWISEGVDKEVEAERKKGRSKL